MRTSSAVPLPRANLAGLILGDLAALLVFTLAGFATHGSLGSAGMRMLTTFVPVTAAWALCAPWLGLYQRDIVRDARQLWRPALVCVLAAPLAAVVRGLWLNAPILPIFALVLTGSAALAMTVWRVLWWLLVGRQAARG